PLGDVGAACKTACDCQSGLGCIQQKCNKPMLGAVYCCESTDCPAMAICQSNTGNFRRCGTSGGGGGPGGGGGGPGGGGGGGGPTPTPDGGTPGFCTFIPCMSSQGCQQAGCNSCGSN